MTFSQHAASSLVLKVSRANAHFKMLAVQSVEKTDKQRATIQLSKEMKILGDRRAT